MERRGGDRHDDDEGNLQSAAHYRAIGIVGGGSWAGAPSVSAVLVQSAKRRVEAMGTAVALPSAPTIPSAITADDSQAVLRRDGSVDKRAESVFFTAADRFCDKNLGRIGNPNPMGSCCSLPSIRPRPSQGEQGRRVPPLSSPLLYPFRPFADSLTGVRESQLARMQKAAKQGCLLRWQHTLCLCFC